MLRGSPYLGYAYAYPHKTAYRAFDQPLPLAELWGGEDRGALFLYVHIPFCEMRCGFCNLFTTANPEASQTTRYLDALERQMESVGEALGPHRFARGAIGGGTPTFLTEPELERLFRLMKQAGSVPEGMPLSCELSPGTSDAGRLSSLRRQGVTRASIGVQSFVEAETRALGRPQAPGVLHGALERLREAGFPVLNLDLIYGIPGQTLASWRRSLSEALEHAPGELFLYPLYVRPLTGLDRLGRDPSDLRPALYEAGRDFLLERGYRQISMRLFRHESVETGEGGVYCCQEDGMVGYGAGARSYTRAVHYCTEYAVGRTGIRAILDEFARRSRREHGTAVYGCRLDEEEQKRRYVIKSLLRADGLDRRAYREWFGADCGEDFPELEPLVGLGLAEDTGGTLRLTARGFAWSDAIGPWLYSRAVRRSMALYELH